MAGFTYVITLNEDSVISRKYSSNQTFHQGVLSGKVVDEKYLPVKGISLSIANKNKKLGIVTDSDGRFLAEDLHGKFSIVSFSDGYGFLALADSIPEKRGVELTIMLCPNYDFDIYEITSQQRLSDNEINSIKLCLRNAFRNRMNFCENCCKRNFISIVRHY